MCSRPCSTRPSGSSPRPCASHHHRPTGPSDRFRLTYTRAKPPRPRLPHLLWAGVNVGAVRGADAPPAGVDERLHGARRAEVSKVQVVSAAPRQAHDVAKGAGTQDGSGPDRRGRLRGRGCIGEPCPQTGTRQGGGPTPGRLPSAGGWPAFSRVYVSVFTAVSNGSAVFCFPPPAWLCCLHRHSASDGLLHPPPASRPPVAVRGVPAQRRLWPRDALSVCAPPGVNRRAGLRTGEGKTFLKANRTHICGLFRDLTPTVIFTEPLFEGVGSWTTPSRPGDNRAWPGWPLGDRGRARAPATSAHLPRRPRPPRPDDCALAALPPCRGERTQKHVLAEVFKQNRV